jgi:hypothetical protein
LGAEGGQIIFHHGGHGKHGVRAGAMSVFSVISVVESFNARLTPGGREVRVVREVRGQLISCGWHAGSKKPSSGSAGGLFTMRRDG